MREKSKEVIRIIDDIGRIVIPISFRKALRLDGGTELRIILRENGMDIRTVKKSCVFCGKDAEIAFNGIYICRDCTAKIKGLTG